MKTVTCAYKNCEIVFEQTRKDKKYCSRHCKTRASDLRNGRSKRWKKNNRSNRSSKDWVYRQHLKDVCEMCGFIPKHICQLDVDHIDGDHNNNELSNLQTLCANCHRYKTYQSKDWEQKP